MLTELNREVTPARHDDWLRWIDDMREKHPSIAIPETDKLLPQYVIKSIYDASGRTPTTSPASASTRCGPRSTSGSTSPHGFITSGGLGTMGFEVPAAIGAQFAAPKRPSGRSAATAASR